MLFTYVHYFIVWCARIYDFLCIMIISCVLFNPIFFLSVEGSSLTHSAGPLLECRSLGTRVWMLNAVTHMCVRSLVRMRARALARSNTHRLSRVKCAHKIFMNTLLVLVVWIYIYICGLHLWWWKMKRCIAHCWWFYWVWLRKWWAACAATAKWHTCLDTTQLDQIAADWWWMIKMI